MWFTSLETWKEKNVKRQVCACAWRGEVNSSATKICFAYCENEFWLQARASTRHFDYNTEFTVNSISLPIVVSSFPDSWPILPVFRFVGFTGSHPSARTRGGGAFNGVFLWVTSVTNSANTRLGRSTNSLVVIDALGTSLGNPTGYFS